MDAYIFLAELTLAQSFMFACSMLVLFGLTITWYSSLPTEGEQGRTLRQSACRHTWGITPKDGMRCTKCYLRPGGGK
jgi:hypothetical protein